VDEWTQGLLARIAEGNLFSEPYYRRLDLDAALDSRESDREFDSQWVKTYEEIDECWNRVEVGTKLRDLAEQIRRQTFLHIHKLTGHHEIAGFVSDDLDLIVRGRLLRINEPFLDRLWQSYERGEFPLPEA
jgi:hypothetical protein